MCLEVTGLESLDTELRVALVDLEGPGTVRGHCVYIAFSRRALS